MKIEKYIIITGIASFIMGILSLISMFAPSVSKNILALISLIPGTMIIYGCIKMLTIKKEQSK